MPLRNMLCDIGAISWEVGQEKIDQRVVYEYIKDELQVVTGTYPYFVRLAERPYETGGVAATGYTIVTSMPTASGEAYVDYEDSRIYFYSTEAGKAVLVTYYGRGSPIIANDVNRFSVFLDTLRDTLRAFVVEAFSPVSRRVRLCAGYIVSGDTLSKAKEQVLDFGPAGNHVLEAITSGYWKKLLVGINTSTVAVSVTEGAEASTEAGTAIPTIPANVSPCAVITIHDSGGGTPGSIDNIENSKIEDARTFLS